MVHGLRYAMAAQNGVDPDVLLATINAALDTLQFKMEESGVVPTRMPTLAMFYSRRSPGGDAEWTSVPCAPEAADTWTLFVEVGAQ